MVGSETICIVPPPLSASVPPGNDLAQRGSGVIRQHQPFFRVKISRNNFCRLPLSPRVTGRALRQLFLSGLRIRRRLASVVCSATAFPSRISGESGDAGVRSTCKSTALFPGTVDTMDTVQKSCQRRAYSSEFANGGLRGRQTAPAPVSGCAGCQSAFGVLSRPIAAIVRRRRRHKFRYRLSNSSGITSW